MIDELMATEYRRGLVTGAKIAMDVAVEWEGNDTPHGAGWEVASRYIAELIMREADKK